VFALTICSMCASLKQWSISATLTEPLLSRSILWKALLMEVLYVSSRSLIAESAEVRVNTSIPHFSCSSRSTLSLRSTSSSLARKFCDGRRVLASVCRSAANFCHMMKASGSPLACGRRERYGSQISLNSAVDMPSSIHWFPNA